jgi:excisionase family DNA binding protein
MAQQIIQAQSALSAPDLMSPADVARRLGVAEPDVLDIIESGQLPAKRIGLTYRIKRSDLDAYLNS